MKGFFDETRAFGVEIEFSRPRNVSHSAIAYQLTALGIETHEEGYNHETREWWKVVSDASVVATRYNLPNDVPQVGRNEIVSPLLFGKNGLEQIEKVCNLLQSLGCTVNVSCGLHVHHDVRDQITNASDAQAQANVEKLTKWVAKFEHCIYKLIAPSRLDNRNYSVPVRKYFYAKRIQLESVMEGNFDGYNNNKNSIVRESVKDVVKNKNSRILQHYRACGLNLYHIFGRGSVEFRYHQGSLNAEKIQNWVILTQMILNAIESKRSVTLKYVQSGTVGMAKFRKALGLGTVKNSEFNSRINEYVKTTYKKFAKRESDYMRHHDYRNYVIGGI